MWPRRHFSSRACQGAALVALAALIAVASVGYAIPALALSGAAGLTVAGLVMWETFD